MSFKEICDLLKLFGSLQSHSSFCLCCTCLNPQLNNLTSEFVFLYVHYYRSWGSSVSIVSDYRLDDRATGVRSPAEAKDFSCSLCVHTSSEAHPASCPLGTGGFFPRGKARPGRDADLSPHLVPRSSMSRSYIFSPPCRLHGSSGSALLYC
jgi:hypothetical protein